MSGEAVVSIVALILVVLACLVGVAAAVVRVVRAMRMRDAPGAGLLRAGAPAGTDDAAVAMRRAEGRYAWTRIGGGF